jgi:hypothetical protein
VASADNDGVIQRVWTARHGLTNGQNEAGPG